ncbi:MAG: SMI1/KNR4 family protein [Anaeromyxobacteraceae bacterium]
MEVIREAAGLALVDDDEEPVVLGVAPGISAERIEALGAEMGFRLPGELLELLPQCSGLEGLLETIDFTGQSGGLELDAIFPRCIPVAHDGYGNYWVLDASPEGADVAPVFFAGHDAPVILYQAPSLAAFLAEVVKMYRPSHDSLVDDVHEDRIFDVWRKNPGTMTVAQAATGDRVLKDFAAVLDERFTVVDLRQAAVGMGFSWGRHGPRTELRRHGDARLFAYAPPTKRSLWSRLTGR